MSIHRKNSEIENIASTYHSYIDWHHRDGSRSGEPIRLIIPAGIVTNSSSVAVQEGHCIEPL